MRVRVRCNKRNEHELELQMSGDWTFIDGVSNLYAEAIDVTGSWLSSEASSLMSNSWSSSSSCCFSSELESNGWRGPFSKIPVSSPAKRGSIQKSYVAINK